MSIKYICCIECSFFSLDYFHDDKKYLCKRCMNQFYECHNCHLMVNVIDFSHCRPSSLCFECKKAFCYVCVDKNLYVKSDNDNDHYSYKCKSCSEIK